MTGNVGNANTDGLAIRYTGEALPGQPNPPDVPASLDPAIQPTEAQLGSLGLVNAGTVARRTHWFSRLARMQTNIFLGIAQYAY